MMDQVLTHPVSLSVKKNLSLLPGITLASRILVGVSGGVDSMVLLYILHKLGYPVFAAHVNFNLRGEESHNDALFVKLWCQEQGISSYELSKDTAAYATSRDLNTQSAARDIRYEWWEHLVHTHQFDFVSTAHHLDDTVETFFLNLLRGTGLKGLKGIPRRRDFYIRPLLECSRAEIESFALTFDIPFRMDSSNLSDHYQRNRVRHHLIPVLEEISPGFHASMKHTLHRVNLEWEVWERTYLDWQKQKVHLQMDGFLLHGESHETPFLLRWLEEKGIPWNLAFDFIASPRSDSGQVLTYDKYKLSRTEDGFYYEEVQPSIHFVFHKPGTFSFGNFSLRIEAHSGDSFIENQNPWTEFVDAAVIQWPLHVRNVRTGDSFHPLGMQGKTKKIQDFMVDLKLEMYEKERVLLLTNEDHIIWVIGHRLDERAKVNPGTRAIYRLSFTATEVI